MWCRPLLNGFVHFEPAGVDGRSFFFGASSGEGGLQMELGFLFIVKRGDVDSLQSPGKMLILYRRRGIACKHERAIPHFSFNRYSIATTFGGHRLCDSWYLMPVKKDRSVSSFNKASVVSALTPCPHSEPQVSTRVLNLSVITHHRPSSSSSSSSLFVEQQDNPGKIRTASTVGIDRQCGSGSGVQVYLR